MWYMIAAAIAYGELFGLASLIEALPSFAVITAIVILRNKFKKVF